MAYILAIAAGVLSALPLIVALVSPGGLILVLLTPLPLFLAGLALGLNGVVIASASAVLVLGLAGGVTAALGGLVTVAGPASLLVRQALLSRPAADGGIEWYPPGPLVAWLVVIGIVWLALAAAMLGGVGQGLESTVRDEISRSLALLLPELAEPDLAVLAERFAPLALGSVVVSWLLLLAVNGVLAQGALARFGRALRPAPDIAGLELPRWIAPALAVSIAVALLGSGAIAYLAQNLALVLAVAFFFVGLAVVHAAARRLRARAPVLIGFYAFMVLFSWPALLVALLGLIEQWAGLRRRLAAGDQGPEEE